MAKKKKRKRKEKGSRRRRDPIERWDTEKQGIDELAEMADQPPYTAQQQAEERLQDRKTKRRFWTIADVAELDTDSIVSRLRDMGVSIDPDAFRKLADGHASAWRLSREWLPMDISISDRDFLGLAACELWKRWVELPSAEQVDDLLTPGYEHFYSEEHHEALTCWLKFWTVFCQRFTTGTKMVELLDFVSEGSMWFLPLWCEDLCRSAVEAEDPNLASAAADILAEVIDLSKEQEEELNVSLDEKFVLRVKRDRGDLLCEAGKKEEGERALRQLMDDYPRSAAGFFTLARIWFDEATETRDRRLLEKALAAFEQIEEGDFEGAKEYDVKGMIRFVKAQLKEDTPDRS